MTRKENRTLSSHIAALITALFLVFTGCERYIYDYEGDCDVHFIVHFTYDMNLKWADAFPSEVTSVNLYVFDNDGVFLKEYSDSGVALSQPGYGIELDPIAGTYKLLAWCGLNNADGKGVSFTVTSPVAGVTTLEDVMCSLNTQSIGSYGETAGIYSTEQLKFLYWGYQEVTLVDTMDGATYNYTVTLTKDTNHVRIILQELNGDDMNPSDYEFSIESTNGLLNWNNTPFGDAVITYEPWSQFNDEVGVGKVDIGSGTLTTMKGVVADMSLSRLMASQSDSMMLKISNRQTGELIATIPLIQYALLSKEYYESAYGHPMTDQEFLDREDEYVMTLFLVNGSWLKSYIYIQQWRIVFHDYDAEYSVR